jgi:hypothetical protein
MVAMACIATPSAQQDIAQTPAIVTSQHQVTIGGTVRRYTARAGTIAIRQNETGRRPALIGMLQEPLISAANSARAAMSTGISPSASFHPSKND